MHYVIGDVHGCYDEMMKLLSKIESEDKDARFVFVGDFVDRGPQVDQVLEWCMKNITPDGKYQSVRGNHEQMVLEWYVEWTKWWREEGFADRQWMPETVYDFSKWADAIDILTPEKLAPYMEFFESFPYDKVLELESKWGERVTFRIVHAYYEYGDVSKEVQHKSNIWKRMYCGNDFSNEIMVHGHTPTLDYEYIYWSVRDSKPGMISYRQNDINLDGGCVFAKEFPMYPVMLCAIRLEDLEEIYAYTVEERFLQNAVNSIEEAYQRERLEKYTREYLSTEGKCRKMMLKAMGHPDYKVLEDAEVTHLPERPLYQEDREVLFKSNEEVLRGTIEIVNPIDWMGILDQPYYDILANVHGTFVLYKHVPESDIVEAC